MQTSNVHTVLCVFLLLVLSLYMFENVKILKQIFWGGTLNNKPWAYCSPSHSPQRLFIYKSIFGPDHFSARVMFLGVWCFDNFRWISHVKLAINQHTLHLCFGLFSGLPQDQCAAYIVDRYTHTFNLYPTTCSLLTLCRIVK